MLNICMWILLQVNISVVVQVRIRFVFNGHDGVVNLELVIANILLLALMCGGAIWVGVFSDQIDDLPLLLAQVVGEGYTARNLAWQVAKQEKLV